MSLQSLRSKAKLGIVAASLASILNARADVIAPSVAHADGAQGSKWRSDLGVLNTLSVPVTVNVYATPRNESEDPSAQPLLTRVVTPNGTMFLEDVYTALHGSGASGVDRLRLKFTDNNNLPTPNLPTTVTVYNKGDAPGVEFGMKETTFDPNTGYYNAGTTLVAQLSKDGFRDGVFVLTGPNGATIEWTYRNSAGANEVKITGEYGKNMTHQYTGNVPQLIGFTPEPNSSLEAKIISGSARTALTNNNNTTNDPAWTDMTPKPEIDKIAIAGAYVGKWLPEGRVFLNGNEVRAMIRGDKGTRSYLDDIATEVYKDPRVVSAFGSIDAVKQWFNDRVDGVAGNSELCPTFDPLQWTQDVGTRIYDGVGCGPVDFKPGSTALNNVYATFKDFLQHYVASNPHLYGGQVAGLPEMSFNPTWNTQDPN